MADQNTQPSSTAGDDRNLVKLDDSYIALSLEDKLQIFWEKNGRVVMTVIGCFAAGLVGKWGFDQFVERRERAIAAEYAAATDAAGLKAFAAAHPTAALAGAAHLRLADEAYAAGNYAGSVADYTAAAKLLAGQALAGRAQMGVAIAQLQAGDVAAAKVSLEALANDTAYPRSLRAESAYHLAVLARDESQVAKAKEWVQLAISVEGSGLWAQRAMQLGGALPEETVEVPATVPAPAATPEGAGSAAPAPAAVSFPATAK